MKKIIAIIIPILLGLLLAGCSDDVEYVTYNVVRGGTDSLAAEPRLTRLEFLSADNPGLLVGDVACTITGDSVAECWVPHVMGSKLLVARFAAEGGEVQAGGTRMESGVTAMDYSQPVTLTVAQSRLYRVYVHAFTGLPVLWIETEGEAPIESKEEYVRASFRLVEDVVTRSPGDTAQLTGQIRGRGNSTWSLPKKPYRLKLDAKAPLLGMPADRSWVLLANYSDKTMVRNRTAMRMGSMSLLAYTPQSHFVELMLNGRYDGTYELCEKLELARHRVDTGGGGGFLLEIDKRAKEAVDGPLIRVEHIGAPIVVKDPGVTAGSEDHAYVSRFLAEADSALFSDGFADPGTGWRKYLDEDSFADWFLVNEISKNGDAYFSYSCFMTLRRGGKLCMGPLWDFDLAFGNTTNWIHGPEGFYIRFVPWYARLLRDPGFKARVKERYEYFYSRRDDILRAVNADAQYLRLSAVENDHRWGTLYSLTWQNHDAWGCYQNEVQHLKEWLMHRMDWLRDELAKM